ncbi:hypothetical protein P175DRAFT_0498035 [Aspergillus ochraceoroseus IBT 24754]|uniref:Uncharacterized protein n=1 Tax=Aspergillus ochraceoroseus IBT 24754 TaxID=1392256 RepID=A0A2T5M8R7_9EURO|nr:uncharacterized protein P175DRAFT_0498035 [Aspergillus ochraceoroseus IBT 24754]PTU24930.1 hypothetical protein P175DRAFT_0498035 [Aspergillus ochraceoroseus IBT 24754]
MGVNGVQHLTISTSAFSQASTYSSVGVGFWFLHFFFMFLGKEHDAGGRWWAIFADVLIYFNNVV